MAKRVWVLDASVAVKWFFVDESLRGKALAVREALATRPAEFVIPHLFHSELVHVLARKSAHDLQFVRQALDLVGRLGTSTIGLSEHSLQVVADLACDGFSGYDATYLALADDLGGLWLTADARAASRAGPARALGLDSWPG